MNGLFLRPCTCDGVFDITTDTWPGASINSISHWWHMVTRSGLNAFIKLVINACKFWLKSFQQTGNECFQSVAQKYSSNWFSSKAFTKLKINIYKVWLKIIWNLKRSLESVAQNIYKTDDECLWGWAEKINHNSKYWHPFIIWWSTIFYKFPLPNWMIHVSQQWSFPATFKVSLSIHIF